MKCEQLLSQKSNHATQFLGVLLQIIQNFADPDSARIILDYMGTHFLPMGSSRQMMNLSPHIFLRYKLCNFHFTPGVVDTGGWRDAESGTGSLVPYVTVIRARRRWGGEFFLFTGASSTFLKGILLKKRRLPCPSRGEHALWFLPQTLRASWYTYSSVEKSPETDIPTRGDDWERFYSLSYAGRLTTPLADRLKLYCGFNVGLSAPSLRALARTRAGRGGRSRVDGP